jgi:signal transduction histidine kinase
VRDISERKLFHSAFERVEQLTTLREVDAELADRLNVEYVATMALDSSVRLTGADAGMIGLMHDDGQLHLADFVGNYTRRAAEEYLQRDDNVVARVLRTRQAELIADVTTKPNDVALRRETVAKIVVPLTSPDHLIGVLYLETRIRDGSTRTPLTLAKMVTARIGTAVENSQLHRQTEEQVIELQDLYEQVHKLEQLKTDMIRIAAHDLRNPISAIMGHVELMQMDLAEMADPGELPRLLDLMAQAADRMYKIVSDILSLERIQQTAHDTVYETFDLAALTHRVFREHRSPEVLGARQMTLSLPDEAVHVRGDPSQLGEAITNLITNAIKYTPPEGQIDIRLHYQDSDVAFEVKDNGYGIREDQQKYLFQPFYRAHSDETAGIVGTGLGLHLVKNIIERQA